VNVVRILPFDGAGRYVTVPVDVQAPPAQGRQYVLVARFDSPYRYKLKGPVPASIATHDVPVDLEEAPPGSSREFAVMAVTDPARVEWESSVDAPSLNVIPEGSGPPLTGWVPYRN
jgi:hypothetical protein